MQLQLGRDRIGISTGEGSRQDDEQKTGEGSSGEIDGDEICTTTDGTGVIVNASVVYVGETIGGGAATAVVEWCEWRKENQ